MRHRTRFITESMLVLVVLIASLLYLVASRSPTAADENGGKGSASAGNSASVAKPGLDPSAKFGGEATDLSESSRAVLDLMRDFWFRGPVLPQHPTATYQPFKVPSRKEALEYFPCMDCHEDDSDGELNNPKERQLEEEHEGIVLTHGGERFWCHTCHNLKDMDYFRSMKNQKIDFDRSYQVCGQCHFERQKDWLFGGHGKRISDWNGERVVLLCVECHNPHSPDIKPRRADPPPKPRAGRAGLFTWLELQPSQVDEGAHRQKIWQIIEARRHQSR